MRRFNFLFVLTIFALSISGCQNKPQSVSVASATPEVISTATAAVPTPTLQPMAAIVNGEGIPQAEYESELKRYESAGIAPSENSASQAVIQELVAQVLFKQGAEKQNFVVDEPTLKSRLDELANQLGGMPALEAWQNQNGYTPPEFETSLSRSIAAAWMRDQIVAAVPATAEQVHAIQILFLNQANANSVLQEVRSGADFATLAKQYDPITGGDLGWFPRGYLTQISVQDVAFTLQPGGVSDVIVSDAGFHIIQVIEKEPDHPLSPEALSTLQRIALQQWLADQTAASKIEIIIK